MSDRTLQLAKLINAFNFNTSNAPTQLMAGYDNITVADRIPNNIDGLDGNLWFYTRSNWLYVKASGQWYRAVVEHDLVQYDIIIGHPYPTGISFDAGNQAINITDENLYVTVGIITYNGTVLSEGDNYTIGGGGNQIVFHDLGIEDSDKITVTGNVETGGLDTEVNTYTISFDTDTRILKLRGSRGDTDTVVIPGGGSSGPDTNTTYRFSFDTDSRLFFARPSMGDSESVLIPGGGGSSLDTDFDLRQKNVVNYESSYSVGTSPVAEVIRISGNGGTFSDSEATHEIITITLDSEFVARDGTVQVNPVAQQEQVGVSGTFNANIADTDEIVRLTLDSDWAIANFTPERFTLFSNGIVANTNVAVFIAAATNQDNYGDTNALVHSTYTQLRSGNTDAYFPIGTYERTQLSAYWAGTGVRDPGQTGNARTWTANSNTPIYKNVDTDLWFILWDRNSEISDSDTRLIYTNSDPNDIPLDTDFDTYAPGANVLYAGIHGVGAGIDPGTLASAHGASAQDWYRYEVGNPAFQNRAGTNYSAGVAGFATYRFAFPHLGADSDSETSFTFTDTDLTAEQAILRMDSDGVWDANFTITSDTDSSNPTLTINTNSRSAADDSSLTVTGSGTNIMVNQGATNYEVIQQGRDSDATQTSVTWTQGSDSYTQTVPGGTTLNQFLLGWPSAETLTNLAFTVDTDSDTMTATWQLEGPQTASTVSVNHGSGNGTFAFDTDRARIITQAVRRVDSEQLTYVINFPYLDTDALRVEFVKNTRAEAAIRHLDTELRGHFPFGTDAVISVDTDSDKGWFWRLDTHRAADIDGFNTTVEHGSRSTPIHSPDTEDRSYQYNRVGVPPHYLQFWSRSTILSNVRSWDNFTGTEIHVNSRNQPIGSVGTVNRIRVSAPNGASALFDVRWDYNDGQFSHFDILSISQQTGVPNIETNSLVDVKYYRITRTNPAIEVTDGFGGHPNSTVRVGNFTYTAGYGTTDSEFFQALASANITGWTVTSTTDSDAVLTATIAGSLAGEHSPTARPALSIDHGTGNGTFELSTTTVVLGQDTEYVTPSNDFLAELMDRPVPTHATDHGVAGAMAYADGYLYICIATNNWQRVQLSTW